MSEVGEKHECPTCHNFVAVMELVPSGNEPNKYIQKLECGHEGRISITDPIYENISINGKPEAKVKKVKSVGESPLFVTDSTGTHLTSGKVELTTYQNNVTGGNIVYNNVTYNMKIDNNTTINNIQNILSMVDSNNNYTPEEKVVIKDTLTKITDLVEATGSTSVKIASLLSLLPGIFHS